MMLSVSAPVTSQPDLPELLDQASPEKVVKKPSMMLIGSLRYKAWIRRQYRHWGPRFRHEHERTRWIKDPRGMYLKLELEIFPCDYECFRPDGGLL
jgi:hypothetical protein